MRPSSAVLSALVNKAFTLDPKLGISTNREGDAIDGGKVVTLTADADSASLSSGRGADTGLWVPYLPKNAVIGFVADGQTWMASGPFSGCEFVVGIEKKGTSVGRVFGAHISKESGSDANAVFKAYAEKNGLSAWYWNKMPMAEDSFATTCFVFAEFGDTGLTSLNRVDIRVRTMGGSDGTVLRVKTFK